MFSKIVKGLSRLMLTSFAVFSIGLFLCGNEVKADTTPDDTIVVSLSSVGSEEQQRQGLDSEVAEVKVVNNKVAGDDNKITITSIIFYSDSTEIFSESGESIGVVTPGGGSYSQKITNNAIISKLGDSGIAGKISGNKGEIPITSVAVKYYIGSASGTIKEDTKSATGVKSGTIYKVSAAIVTNGTGVNATAAEVKISDSRSGSTTYGCAGESYSISVTPVTDTNVDKYYQKVYVGDTAPAWNSGGWTSGSTSITGDDLKISSDTANNARKVTYFPKITGITINTTLPKEDKLYLPNADTHSVDLSYTISAGIDSTDSSIVKGKVCLLPDMSTMGTNINELSASITGDQKMTITLGKSGSGVNSALINTGMTGSLSGYLKTYGTGEGEGAIETDGPGYFAPQQVTIYNTIYACPEPKTVDTIEDTLETNDTLDVGLDNMGVPAGADWKGILDNSSNIFLVDSTNASGKVLTASVTTSDLVISYDKSKHVIHIEPKSGIKAGGTVSFNIKVKDPNTGNREVLSVPFKITLAPPVDATETKSAIDNSNQNFITMGSSLDLKALCRDYSRDASKNAKNKEPNYIEVSNGSIDATTGVFTPSSTGSTTVRAEWGSVTVTFEVITYPKATATYNNGRTVTVTMPYKVSTGYKADGNLKEVKGFYFALEDSSGNTLASYDASKYENMAGLDSKYMFSKNDATRTMTFTIPASEIESLVTTAASNNKFSTSNETTSVKFRAIPRGYAAVDGSSWASAPSSTSGETAVTSVYRVKASGSNFSDSYAFGLDGQSVNLVAYPKDGYKFTRWEDGSTSNPRTVTVSSTGSRNFGVLGDRISSSSSGTGSSSGSSNGRGTGSGNSSLYDDVPRTAESSSAIWLIVFMVFAVMGTAYALYLQLKAASKNGKK